MLLHCIAMHCNALQCFWSNALDQKLMTPTSRVTLLQEMKILQNQNDSDDRTAPIENKFPTSKIGPFKLLQKVAVHHDASTGTQPSKDKENACDQWTVQTGAVSVEEKKFFVDLLSWK